MKNKFFGLNLDFIGFTASILCALHCAALPLILAVTATTGSSFIENSGIEVLVIATSVIIAGAAVFKGYLKHKQTKPLYFIAIGFILLIAGHAFHSLVLEVILISIGAVFIASAHVTNWKLTNKACRYNP